MSDFPLHLGAETSETCNTYNMLKLTRHLFAWDPSAADMDFYERGLYNHILASQDPATGGMTYFCPLKPGSFRTYSTPTDAFWCCVGTGMENHAKYPDSIYFHGTDSIWVNLFIPSLLTWREQGITLRQETRFPDEDTSRLTITVDRPRQLTLKIRYPSWTGAGATVAVNGQPVTIDGQPGSYLSVSRQWQSGDVVSLRLPMPLHLVPLPGDAKTVAVFAGPILLAGDLGRADVTAATRLGLQAPELARLQAVDAPGLVSSDGDVLAGIKPTGAPLTFVTSGLARPNDVRLLPFFRADGMRYSVYWHLYSPSEWAAHRHQVDASTETRRRIDASTIDHVDTDNADSEKSHQGQNLQEGRRPWFEGRNGRESKAAPFGYTLKVKPDSPVSLVTTYRAGDGTTRAFDVLVEGKVLASESLALGADELVEREHAVPATLTRGKSSIAVTYRPHAGAITGAVFDVRTVGSVSP